MTALAALATRMCLTGAGPVCKRSTEDVILMIRGLRNVPAIFCGRTVGCLLFHSFHDMMHVGRCYSPSHSRPFMLHHHSRWITLRPRSSLPHSVSCILGSPGHPHQAETFLEGVVPILDPLLTTRRSTFWRPTQKTGGKMGVKHTGIRDFKVHRTP